MVSNYLFRRNTSVNGISVGKVVGQSNSERFSLVLVNGTDKRGVVHKSFQIGHHLVARIGIAVFVVVPELTKTLTLAINKGKKTAIYLVKKFRP